MQMSASVPCHFCYIRDRARGFFSAEDNTPQHFSQECILNIRPPGHRYTETESILGNFQPFCKGAKLAD